MECSNKGICDREAGVCECFPGYEGSACQRASCPGGSGADACSGHGTCHSIQEIAADDSSNIYQLWDKEATLGCVCDAGYYGADCALRECKYGADPLYYDDNANIRYSNWTIQFSVSGASSAYTVSGEWAIIFYDHFGEDWQTDPLPAGASCAQIITALEGLPNDVIPGDSVRCRKFASPIDVGTDTNWEDIVPQAGHADFGSFPFTNKYKYTLMFPSNPGYLKEIRVNMHLDGARPSLYTNEPNNSTLTAFVFANGFHGEDDDLVPDECENVLVTFKELTAVTAGADADDYEAAQFTDGENVFLENAFYLSFGDGTDADASIQAPLLKRCLGDADNRVNDDNMADEVYDWDYGSEQNPHLVKFIEATENIESRICHSTRDIAWMDSISRGGGETMYGWCFERSPAGFYAPVIYRRKASANGQNRALNGWFVVYSQAPEDFGLTTQFRVFTTTGYLNRVRQDGDVFTHWTKFQDFYSNVLYTVNRGVNINTGSYPSSPVEGFVNPATPFRSNNAEDDNYWLGNMDCETSPPRNIFYEDCLEKGDYVMFFSVENTNKNYLANPKYHNMYKVDKIFIAYPLVDTAGSQVEEPLRARIVLDKHVNFAWPRWTHNPIDTEVDRPPPLDNTHVGVYDDDENSNHMDDARLRAYKFYPPAAKVTYVDECSGRGLCNAAEGLCECFPGYTNDDCSVQNGGSH